MAPDPDDVRGYEVVEDRRIGEGGFLVVRRLRLRLRRADGSRSAEGLYDIAERPMGLDAVVVVLYHRTDAGRVDVLIRSGPRVPLAFGRSKTPPVGESGLVPLKRSSEVVAGILEVGEDDEPALRRRAVAEALEEAGLVIAADRVTRLDAPLFPTPGMCPELFHFVACEIEDPRSATRPLGDGSPFEEGAQLEWLPLEQAIADCRGGRIEDMKTEVALVRLRDQLQAFANERSR